ncbi:MAG TPA: protein kinase [Acidimicrobiales bacterium]|nr:protein kinase [Acidimicrobiales bacterium]
MARFGDYLLVRRLGEGAHGRSYLAEPPLRLGVSDEYVVLKVLHRDVTEDEFARATAHLTSIASVLSPYLARPLDVLRVDRSMGIVTEHVAGGSLDAPSRPIGRRDVMQAVADAALGAHALHEAGIAHANITPSNILLGTRCAKLADASLLAVLDPGRTTAGTRAGDSVDLTDPALLLGAEPSRASDVWSLGATLHRMLTGQSLFGVVPDVGETEALRHVIVAPARLGPSLSPAEARVIADCVSDDPVERPLTAEALASRLRSLLLAA